MTLDATLVTCPHYKAKAERAEVETIVEHRLAAMRQYKPAKATVEFLRILAACLVGYVLRNVSDSQGEAISAFLDEARRHQQIKAIDVIKMLVEVGLVEDGGERYFHDLCGTDGLGQLKFPSDTDLHQISLDDFLRQNPEMYDDLSGWLDGTRNRDEKMQQLLTALKVPAELPENCPA